MSRPGLNEYDYLGGLWAHLMSGVLVNFHNQLDTANCT
jgi:hypothetical protein